MDIRLFLAVLWRFKALLLGGLVLAGVVALFAYGTPTTHGITPHGTSTYQSQAELLITTASCPYCRASDEYTPGSAKTNTPSVPVGDQQYLSALAPDYVAIANGNPVQVLIHKAARVPGSVSATEVTDASTAQGLPFIDMTSTATSAAAAAKLASTGASVLSNYVGHEEVTDGVAPSDRVELQILQNGHSPQLTKGTKATLPLLAFIGIFGAAIALAFILESVWPETAVRLGRVPGGPGPGSRVPADAPVALNPGAAVVRLDHLLAGVHEPSSEFGEDDIDRGAGASRGDQVQREGEADGRQVKGEAGDLHDIDGAEFVAGNGDAPATWPKPNGQTGAASAAKSLWEAARQNWAASQHAKHGAPLGSDSDD